MDVNYICYNNKFYPENQPVFTINRAMKFGDGLFESIRIINGKPKFLDFHFHRLQKGLELLKIEFSHQKWNEIRTCLTQLIIKNEIDEGGYLRLTVFRSGAGKYLPDSNHLEYFIEGKALEKNEYALNSKGLVVGIANQKLKPTPFSSIKTLNSLPYVSAAIEADERVEDELILLNTKGNIVESTSSNIFLVFGNNIITPSLEEGCLDGVFRRHLISKLKESNYSLSVLPIEENLLERADEIFLTNSILGIQWVGAYQRKRYFNKVARQLLQNI